MECYKPAMVIKRHQSIRQSILFILLAALSLLLIACSNEHSGKEIKRYSGDYVIYAGIAEIFDCEEQVKYNVSKRGAYAELAEQYAALGLRGKEDAYMQVEGYLEEEEQMEGIDPKTMFVATRFISADPSRGCERGHRVGH